MKRNINLPARKSAVACSVAAMGLLAAAPAFADSEIEALKQQVAEQGRLIQRLLTTQQSQKQEIDSVKSTTTPASNATDPSRVAFTAYGVLDVNVANTNSGFGSKTTFGSGGMEASYLGVSARKALGDTGLTAVGTLEAGIGIDTAGAGNAAAALGTNVGSPSSGGLLGTGSQLFSRQAFVGIASDKGTLTFGRQYAPSYLAVAGVGSAFVAGFFGNPTTLISSVGGMPTRLNNSLVYKTPVINGFLGHLIYSTGSENNTANDTVVGATTTNSKAGAGYDLALFYTKGPLKAVVTTWNVNNASYATVGENGLAKKTGVQEDISYDFGFIKLYGMHFDGKISGGNYENVTKTLSSSSGSGISASVPFGKHKIYMGYGRLNDKSLLNKDASIFGVSYSYEIATGANAYVSWGKVKNEANSAYPLISASDILGTVATPGYSPSGLMVGLNYKFAQ
ncbi:MAG: porin [Candidatus Paceibacterota bacterium]